MKKFTEFINEGKIELTNTIDYISAPDLKKYLTITNKFLSQEGKDIVNWLITNNSDYIAELGKNGTSDNALIDFYNAGKPKDATLQELYKNIGALYKKNRLLEIPILQTPEQFSAIINKEISPDELLLDLNTAKGKNDVARQYTPLVYKIARTRLGKSTATFDDLISAGFEGLNYAIQNYGKKTAPDFNAEETGINIDMTRKKAVTFLTYASSCIFNHLVGMAEHDSHVVRIPNSRQATEKRENGRMIRQNTVSGEQKVGNKSADSEGKSLFDYIGTDSHDAAFKMDMEDCEKLWERAKKKLLEHFDKKTIDIFCSFYGLWNYEKMKNKELAKKYNCATSNITAINKKVLTYINTDKEMKDMFKDIWELMKEALHDRDAAEHDDVYITGYTGSTNNKLEDAEDAV